MRSAMMRTRLRLLEGGDNTGVELRCRLLQTIAERQEIQDRFLNKSVNLQVTG
jgi:hypothetical protein